MFISPRLEETSREVAERARHSSLSNSAQANKRDMQGTEFLDERNVDDFAAVIGNAHLRDDVQQRIAQVVANQGAHGLE